MSEKEQDLTTPPNGVLQNELEVMDTIVLRAHEIYGPVLAEQFGGDAYKISYAIGILSNAMTLHPGSYIGAEEPKDKKFKAIPGGKGPNAETVDAMKDARAGRLKTVPPGKDIIQVLNDNASDGEKS